MTPSNRGIQNLNCPSLLARRGFMWWDLVAFSWVAGQGIPIEFLKQPSLLLRQKKKKKWPSITTEVSYRRNGSISTFPDLLYPGSPWPEVQLGAAFRAGSILQGGTIPRPPGSKDHGHQTETERGTSWGLVHPEILRGGDAAPLGQAAAVCPGWYLFSFPQSPLLQATKLEVQAHSHQSPWVPDQL